MARAMLQKVWKGAEMGYMITRVFTKYDKMVLRIYFPTLRAIERCEISDYIYPTFNELFALTAYGIVDVEEGLEGVRFVHYEQEKK